MIKCSPKDTKRSIHTSSLSLFFRRGGAPIFLHQPLCKGEKRKISVTSITSHQALPSLPGCAQAADLHTTCTAGHIRQPRRAAVPCGPRTQATTGRSVLSLVDSHWRAQRIPLYNGEKDVIARVRVCKKAESHMPSSVLLAAAAAFACRFP